MGQLRAFREFQEGTSETASRKWRSHACQCNAVLQQLALKPQSSHLQDGVELGSTSPQFKSPIFSAPKPTCGLQHPESSLRPRIPLRFKHTYLRSPFIVRFSLTKTALSCL